MILRRITEHVSAQNWFAVGTDFVIVVVGVFIGIQVANLNDDRLDRIESGTRSPAIFSDRPLTDRSQRPVVSRAGSLPPPRSG